MSNDSKRLAHQFASSLERWGGWESKSTGDTSHLTTDASSYVTNALSEDPLRTNRFEDRKDEWRQMVHLSRAFLNTCLIQQLDHWASGPGSLDELLDSLGSPIEALMLFSLILCGREHGLGVSVPFVWTLRNEKARGVFGFFDWCQTLES